MRIVGHIEDPIMKITVLEMNHRLSLKFEHNLLEQTYKLQVDSGAEELTKLKSLVTDEVRTKVMKQFNDMHELRKSLHADAGPETFQFPEII